MSYVEPMSCLNYSEFSALVNQIYENTFSEEVIQSNYKRYLSYKESSVSLDKVLDKDLLKIIEKEKTFFLNKAKIINNWKYF